MHKRESEGHYQLGSHIHNINENNTHSTEESISIRASKSRSSTYPSSRGQGG